MASPVVFTKLFIGNQWVDGVEGKTFATYDPSTGLQLAVLSEATQPDVDRAVAAAKAAFARGSPWRAGDASTRGRLLNKLADAIERDSATLAELESRDNGKPYSVALAADIGNTIKCFRYFAGWADKICGRTIPIDGDFLSLTRLEPIGVCAQIIPWNFPLLMAAWKLAPALAAGCCVVIKSAEQTPLSLLHLASLIAEVGFPPGVVNCLSGFGPTCGAHMVVHRDVDKVAFTGSAEVGKIIQREASATLKNVTLELGGKSPAIVCEDCEFESTIEVRPALRGWLVPRGTHTHTHPHPPTTHTPPPPPPPPPPTHWQATHGGLFFNAGQNCCASSRIFVHESIYERFVAAAAARAARVTLGNGFTSGADQGPQVDQPSLDKIKRLVASGVAAGARVATGGEQPPELGGLFFKPTVFADVTDDMEIAREEIFGPVLCVLKYRTLEEAIERANASEYGLAGAVFTTSLDKATQVSLGLRCGTVWVNTYNMVSTAAPFGGYKSSGTGRELGEYGLQQYSEVKTITIALPKGTKNT
jgi:aldehyde dehydrogenase (NAD+)